MIDESADTIAAPIEPTPKKRRSAGKPRPGARRLLRGLAIGGAVVIAIAGRVVVGSAMELERGDEAMAGGDPEGARMHWRRAAAWYAPGNPYCVRALERLEELAVEATEAGAIDDAVLAWRAVRSAIVGARGLTTPHADRLARADDRIATLMLQQEHAPMDSDKSDSELREAYAAQLAHPPGASPGGAILALFGFALWVVAAFRMSQRAFDDDDRFDRRVGLMHLGAVLLGLVLFATGLSIA
ncbi:MAG: hypothetical protein JJ863_03565 [Deltaproteobacteria bacterium]|nr:hypothetical protein [Deltaproteobacteria bacterium]